MHVLEELSVKPRHLIHFQILCDSHFGFSVNCQRKTTVAEKDSE